MLNKKDIDKIKKEVEDEFPDDLALQQIHIARKIISKEAEMKSLKYINYIRELTKNINAIY